MQGLSCAGVDADTTVATHGVEEFSVFYFVHAYGDWVKVVLSVQEFNAFVNPVVDIFHVAGYVVVQRVPFFLFTQVCSTFYEQVAICGEAVFQILGIKMCWAQFCLSCRQSFCPACVLDILQAVEDRVCAVLVLPQEVGEILS